MEIATKILTPWVVLALSLCWYLFRVFIDDPVKKRKWANVTHATLDMFTMMMFIMTIGYAWDVYVVLYTSLVTVYILESPFLLGKDTGKPTLVRVTWTLIFTVIVSVTILVGTNQWYWAVLTAVSGIFLVLFKVKAIRKHM